MFFLFGVARNQITSNEVTYIIYQGLVGVLGSSASTANMAEVLIHAIKKLAIFILQVHCAWTGVLGRA